MMSPKMADKRPRQAFTKIVGLTNAAAGTPPPVAARVLDVSPYDRIVTILNFSSGQYGLTRDQAARAGALISLGSVATFSGLRIPRGNELWFAHTGTGRIVATFIVTELPEGA